MSPQTLRQAMRFALVGIANTAVGLGTIWALKFFGRVADVPANFLGYCVGLACSFVLNRRWTFEHRGAVLPALLRFLLVFAVAYGANLGCMLMLRDHFGVNAYWAHLLATVPYTVLFFIGSRTLAFRSSPT